MKRYLNIFFVGFFLVLSSCDDNFDEINTDPNRAGADIFDPNLILPNVLAGYANTTVGYSGSILFQSMWTQTWLQRPLAVPIIIPMGTNM